MRIAEGIEVLDLNLGRMVIHPVVLIERDSWTLIDTGMPGTVGAIRELARQAGVGDLPLRHIVLTHQDLDHIGGLPELLEGSEGVEVYAHPDDAGAINGTVPMLKMTPERLSGMLEQMPDALRSGFERTFLQPDPERPNVTRLLADGETLPIGGGLTVIHTPGHTPGHVSLYHRAGKTLITGDATVAADGELTGPNPAHTPNWEQALASLRKFKAFDVDRIVCYHGGLVQGDANARIARLADRS